MTGCLLCGERSCDPDVIIDNDDGRRRSLGEISSRKRTKRNITLQRLLLCHSVMIWMIGIVILLLLRQSVVVDGFKLPPLGSQRERPSTSPSEPTPPPKVLVVGATGRIGSLVVRGLVDRGYRVVALARDPDGEKAKALAMLNEAQNDHDAVAVRRGDVTDPKSLSLAMKGCVACISCHGASRVTRLFDLFAFGFTSDYPITHPYCVNYLGLRNLIVAAKQAGCPKLIRVSGLSVGYSAFNPVAILLNLVISFAIRWQLAAEMAIRGSGIDYTVIRPGALTNDKARPDDLVIASDGQGVPVGKISRQDVANLCISSLESAKASNSTFSCVSTTPGSRATATGTSGAAGGEKGGDFDDLEDLVVSTTTTASSNTKNNKSSNDKAVATTSTAATNKRPNDDPLRTYKMLIRREGRPDITPLKPKAHRLAVAVFVVGVSVLGWGLLALLGRGLQLLLTKWKPQMANAAGYQGSRSSNGRRPPRLPFVTRPSNKVLWNLREQLGHGAETSS